MLKRILLKLSGEALLGQEIVGKETALIIARSVKQLQEDSIQVGIVIGGGNIFRGNQNALLGISRVASDQMGMLATLINGIALQELFISIGCKVKVLSAIACGNFVEEYSPAKAIAYLEQGFALIFVGGTGMPFFTTDTAAALRAIEIGADIMLKATKVDGVYDKDPHKYPDAVKYDKISYSEVLEKSLAVMDLTATALCMENQLPILVFDIFAQDSLKKAVFQSNIGTLVSKE
ncbi:MAG: UMP kinase [Chlamydiales bacterium]|nr:UMP kinase [Chlamydiales bacterium]